MNQPSPAPRHHGSPNDDRGDGPRRRIAALFGPALIVLLVQLISGRRVAL